MRCGRRWGKIRFAAAEFFDIAGERGGLFASMAPTCNIAERGRKALALNGDLALFLLIEGAAEGGNPPNKDGKPPNDVFSARNRSRMFGGLYGCQVRKSHVVADRRTVPPGTGNNDESQ